jgi:hypothetical protein
MRDDVFAEVAKGVEHLPAEADIHPPVAQTVECGHALHDVQRVIDRGRHHADAEADRGQASPVCDHTARTRKVSNKSPAATTIAIVLVAWENF